MSHIPIQIKGGVGEFWRDNGKIIFPFLFAIGICILGEILVPGFMKLGPMLLRIKVAAFLGIIALAQVTVIISGGGGIDLSIGNLATLGVVFSAVIMKGRNEYIIPAILCVAAFGLILGLINGYFVAYIRIHPLVVTMAMGLIAYGIVLIYGQGRKMVGNPAPIIDFLANGRILGFPVIILIWIFLILFADFILRRTRTGQKLFSVGTNDTAATLAGVNVKTFRLWVYAVSGIISTIFGVLLLGYVHQPYWDIGEDYVFPSVIASTIGGVAITGGSGSYLGSMGGALVFTFLQSLLVSLRMEEAFKQALFGLILIILLIAYSRESRR
jgi:ribose transport system permease protein